MRRDEHTHIVVVGVVEIAIAVAQLLQIIIYTVGIAVVLPVAAAIDIAQHDGILANHSPSSVVRLRTHVATYIVATIDVAEAAAPQPHHRRVLDVGHSAAAIDVLDNDSRVGGTLHQRPQRCRRSVFPTVKAVGAVGR